MVTKKMIILLIFLWVSQKLLLFSIKEGAASLPLGRLGWFFGLIQFVSVVSNNLVQFMKLYLYMYL